MLLSEEFSDSVGLKLDPESTYGSSGLEEESLSLPDLMTCAIFRVYLQIPLPPKR